MVKELLNPWVKELTLQQQAVLVLALRGCDGLPKEDPSKKILRYYRFMVLRNARPLSPDNIFMVEHPPTSHYDFVSNLDHYPVHWLMHFIHACEVVGYKHPDQQFRNYWYCLYAQLVHNLHLNVETEEALDARLKH